MEKSERNERIGNMVNWSMSISDTAKQLVSENKGILAADESLGTIKKRFDAIGLESNEETRQNYRKLLFTTSELEKYISGVILFEETLLDGLGKYLTEKGILIGIKVDQGKEPFSGSDKEYITKGLNGLSNRLLEYKSLGAVFTKWRALFVIDKDLPSNAAIEKNASILAKYAHAAQASGLVPIVEPEVLMEGNHSLIDSQKANYRVLKKVFLTLSETGVDFSGMLLKPSWVHSGKEIGEPDDDKLAQATIRVLKETVPFNVAGIVFLSGGDNPENATKHLSAINKISPNLWKLSFSFGRALQEPVLKSWAGKVENVRHAQEKLLERARANSRAIYE